MRTILFFSNDQKRLDTLSAILKTVPDFIIISAFDDSAVRAIIEQFAVDILVADTDHCGTCLPELLQWCKSEYPRVYRIILREERVAPQFRTLVTLAHGSLQVPSTRLELGQFFARINRDFPELPPVEKKEIIPEVPPVPLEERIGAVFSICREEQLSQTALASLIAQDKEMSALVLNRINSPYYALSTHISSPERAVMLLGINGTLTVLAESIESEMI